MDYLEYAEKAVTYLRDSEEDYAMLKAAHQADKERIKIVEASQVLSSDAKSAALKEREAKDSEHYREAVDRWQESMEAFYLIEAKRKRAELTIEMYRSVNSALKRGNI